MEYLKPLIKVAGFWADLTGKAVRSAKESTEMARKGLAKPAKAKWEAAEGVAKAKDNLKSKNIFTRDLLGKRKLRKAEKKLGKTDKAYQSEKATLDAAQENQKGMEKKRFKARLIAGLGATGVTAGAVAGRQASKQ